MFCFQCGERVAEDAKLCQNCGTAVKKNNAAQTCTQLHHINAPPTNAAVFGTPTQQSTAPQAGMYGNMQPHKIKNSGTTGVLVWSIVNTCCLYPFIMPIFAIVQSLRSRRSPNSEAVKKHKKNAVLLNLLTYAVFAVAIALIIWLQTSPSSDLDKTQFDGIPLSIIINDREYGITELKLHTDKSTGHTNVWIRTNLSYTNAHFPIECSFIVDGVEYKASRMDFGITENLGEVAVWYYFSTNRIPERVFFYPVDNESDKHTVICISP